MILLANLINGIATILHYILNLFIWVILIRVILSWIQVPSLYQLRVIFYQLTEPVLRPIRRIVPPYRFGGLDISPIIAFILILFIDTVFIRSLSLYAQQILRSQIRTF